jgi:hypothetical protein
MTQSAPSREPWMRSIDTASRPIAAARWPSPTSDTNAARCGARATRGVAAIDGQARPHRVDKKNKFARSCGGLKNDARTEAEWRKKLGTTPLRLARDGCGRNAHAGTGLGITTRICLGAGEARARLPSPGQSPRPALAGRLLSGARAPLGCGRSATAAPKRQGLPSVVRICALFCGWSP